MATFDFSNVPRFQLCQKCWVTDRNTGSDYVIKYAVEEYYLNEQSLLKNERYDYEVNDSQKYFRESKSGHKYTDYESCRENFLGGHNKKEYSRLLSVIEEYREDDLLKLTGDEYEQKVFQYLRNVKLIFEEWFGNWGIEVPQIEKKETTTNLLENANSSVNEERVSAEEDIDSTNFENKKPLTVLAREILNKKDVKEEVMKKLPIKQRRGNRKWQLSDTEVVRKHFKGFYVGKIQESTLKRYVKRFRSGTLK